MPNTGVDKAKDICRHQHCVQMFGSRVHSLLNSGVVRVDVLRQTKEEKKDAKCNPSSPTVGENNVCRNTQREECRVISRRRRANLRA